jgi:hypothetical protein
MAIISGGLLGPATGRAILRARPVASVAENSGKDGTEQR